DEAALPILLVDLLRRNGGLSEEHLRDFWPMVRRAAGFVACNGPVTQQDRWEEDPGYSPFTLAAEIAGLLVAAELAEIHGEDVLALVRFGLRAPDDPRIVSTVKAIDALLKVDLPQGPCWHRYNDDGYGEHDDGSPFDGTGRGRAWPLLTGERAHYELAAGRRD